MNYEFIILYINKANKETLSTYVRRKVSDKRMITFYDVRECLAVVVKSHLQQTKNQPEQE